MFQKSFTKKSTVPWQGILHKYGEMQVQAHFGGIKKKKCVWGRIDYECLTKYWLKVLWLFFQCPMPNCFQLLFSAKHFFCLKLLSTLPEVFALFSIPYERFSLFEAMFFSLVQILFFQKITVSLITNVAVTRIVKNSTFKTGLIKVNLLLTIRKESCPRASFFKLEEDSTV